MKIKSALDILGSDDEADALKVLAYQRAIEEARAKSGAKSDTPRTKSAWTLKDAAVALGLLLVGASPVIGGVWLYNKIKK